MSLLYLGFHWEVALRLLLLRSRWSEAPWDQR
jgi:hypothetical protein